MEIKMCGWLEIKDNGTDKQYIYLIVNFTVNFECIITHMFDSLVSGDCSMTIKMFCWLEIEDIGTDKQYIYLIINFTVKCEFNC